MQHVRKRQGRTATAALEVASVSHSYGAKRALNEISFAIAPATFTVLLGLNGAGKTTLFSLISHLYSTRRGAIRIFGHDIASTLRRGAATSRHRFPGAHARPRPQRPPESLLPRLAARHRRGRGEAAHRGAARNRRDGRASPRQGAQPVGRPDAAHRDRPCPAPPAAAAAAGRGDGGAGRAVARGILANIRSLVETEGISVFWATHLIDEVDPARPCRGARGRQSGRQWPGCRGGADHRRRASIREAFAQLTGSPRPSGGGLS